MRLVDLSIGLSFIYFFSIARAGRSHSVAVLAPSPTVPRAFPHFRSRFQMWGRGEGGAAHFRAQGRTRGILLM